ncbi:MAG: prephenate dehydratase [Mycobacterium kyogaense]|uniref:prephenate dehydratase n=1 Tax=Mycobacterium kyogaense TaxID=2212479 RepID=UPI002FF8CCAC
MSRIAYLGPEGTFTEAALRTLDADHLIPAPGPVTRIATDSTPAAVAAVRCGEADFACVPIENSIEGSVLPTLDSLADGPPVQIYAELTLDVSFTIAVQPGVATESVRTVAAFPVATAQVRKWLAENLPDTTLLPALSNAAAAAEVAAGRADAAVTTALATELYGLDAVASGVVDEPNARTRFVLVGAPAAPPARTGADRTSVVLRLANVPGSLAMAMTELAIRDIDLTRIESRPTRTELGSYKFFLDFVGHIDDGPVADALRALHRRCDDVRYLGSWPTGDPAGTPPPTTDEATTWLTRLREGTP